MLDKLKQKSVMFNSAVTIWNKHKVCAILVLILVAALIIK